MADNKDKTPQERAREASDPSNVKTLQAEELSLGNILRMSLQIRETKYQTKTLIEEMQKLSKGEAKNIGQYARDQKDLNTSLKKQEELKAKISDLEGLRDKRSKQDKADAKDELKIYENIARVKTASIKELEKTRAVALAKRKQENDIEKRSLVTERDLIKAINKERGGFPSKISGGLIGSNVQNLFRSKSRKQLQVDIGRANVGGGSQVSTGGKGGTGGGTLDTIEQVGGSGALGPYGMAAAALAKQAKAMIAPIKELGNQIKAGLTAPFADAAGLLTGEDFGMGSGKAKASGATSILGGLSSILSKIPLIGGILGGVVDMFKAMLDAVLGIEQANFRVGRALNISSEAADKMRDHFIKVGKASDNIVVNDARMFQSLVEINKQLGTNLQIRDDILVNDVKLRDILGLEVESRKVLSDQALATGRDARELTKSAIGTVGAFNKLVGTSFKFSDILGEASKLAGVMGLTLTKYPEKIYKAISATKALGFDLKQLDSTAESFLDFEGSISKEMEAQVLTGKDMNLTLAREAALNNDNVTLAKEITKNVGSANAYLKMNRIQQEAIAQSVGLSRDSLADILKKQVIYNRAGVEDEKGLVRKLDLLEKQGVQQKEISRILGEDGYKTATQVSTAEKLSEIMERIKRTFVEFIKSSGLFEFMTDPAKINNFIKGLADKLASTISMIGEIIATMLEGVSHLPFTDTDKWQGLAASVRMGSGGLAGSIRATTDSLGGAPAGSISGNVEKGTKQENNYKAKASAATTGVVQPIQNNIYVTVDEMAMAKASTNNAPLIPGQTQC